MGALLGFFGAGGLQLKALIVGAGVLLITALALTAWALSERSGRLSLKVEVVTLRAQTDVLADSLGRCNAGVERLRKAGAGAIAETKRLLGMVETGLLKTAAMREEARSIVSRPPPVRPDGKPKDCGDALKEIAERTKVKP